MMAERGVWAHSLARRRLVLARVGAGAALACSRRTLALGLAAALESARHAALEAKRLQRRTVGWQIKYDFKRHVVQDGSQRRGVVTHVQTASAGLWAGQLVQVHSPGAHLHSCVAWQLCGDGTGTERNGCGVVGSGSSGHANGCVMATVVEKIR